MPIAFSVRDERSLPPSRERRERGLNRGSHAWHITRNESARREEAGSVMEELIVRAANMMAYGAAEAEIRAMLLRETTDEGLAFLLLTAARLLLGASS
jgi:hypothetical protein